VLTDAERRVITGPIPEFGDFETLLTRTRALLHLAGYGEDAPLTGRFSG